MEKSRKASSLSRTFDAPASAAVSCKNFDNSQQQKKWNKRKLKIFLFSKISIIFEFSSVDIVDVVYFRIRRNSNVFGGTEYFMWGGDEKDRSIFLKQGTGNVGKLAINFCDWVEKSLHSAEEGEEQWKERKVLYFSKNSSLNKKNQLTKKIGTENFHFR